MAHPRRNPMSASPPLCIFVYGSLKRGGSNHLRFCGDYRSAVVATAVGTLYRQPSGYPMLAVPQEHVLAIGTRNVDDDVQTQQTLADRNDWKHEVEPGDDWEKIEGEILTFDEVGQRLKLLDLLEGFRPGKPSLYHRVVTLVEHERIEPVWTYVAPNGQPALGSIRIGSRWD